VGTDLGGSHRHSIAMIFIGRFAFVAIFIRAV